MKWSSELNSPIPVHFSLLIPNMPTFSLAISCLTTSNLPWFMDLGLNITLFLFLRKCNLAILQRLWAFWKETGMSLFPMWFTHLSTPPESPHSCGNVAITQYRRILNNDNELERKHFLSKEKFHHNFLYGLLTEANIYIYKIHIRVLGRKINIPGSVAETVARDWKPPGFPIELSIFLGCSLKIRNGQIQKEYIYMHVCMHT